MKKLTGQELKQAVQTLGLLVRRDYPLKDALKSLGDKGTPWVEVSERVAAGDSVGQAMRRYPHVFSDFFSGMVEAAAESHQGEAILKALSEWLEVSDAVRRQVRDVLHYPMLTVTFLFIEIGVMLGYALPALVLPMVYVDRGGVPDTLYSSLSLAGYLFFGAAAVALFSTWRIERLFPLALKVPGFRRVTLKADQALWARAVAAFVQAGTPLPEALERCRGLVWNQDLAAELRGLAPRLREGDSFSRALSDLNLIDPQIRWAVTAGENREDLSATLLFAAERLEHGLERQCRTFIVFLQPAALLAMGLLTTAVLAPFWWAMYHFSWNLGGV